MKYAIIGPRGRIFQVLDSPTDRTVEITDEQTATFNSSELPVFLVDGELKTLEEVKLEAMSPERRAAYEAAQKDGWDGEGAASANPDSFAHATKLLAMLP